MADRFSINDTLLGIRSQDADGRQGYFVATIATSADGDPAPFTDATGDDVSGPVDNTPAVGGFVMAFNGLTYDRLRGDTNGLVVQSGLSATFWNYAAGAGGIVNSTTAVTIKAATAAARNYLKTMTIANDTLGSATEIAIRDGAGGAVLWRSKIQTTASGDRVIPFDPPLKGSVNTLLEVVTLTASVTGGVFVNATGYTGA